MSSMALLKRRSNYVTYNGSYDTKYHNIDGPGPILLLLLFRSKFRRTA